LSSRSGTQPSAAAVVEEVDRILAASRKAPPVTASFSPPPPLPAEAKPDAPDSAKAASASTRLLSFVESAVVVITDIEPQKVCHFVG
jgi:hypothetical protein